MFIFHSMQLGWIDELRFITVYIIKHRKKVVIIFENYVLFFFKKKNPVSL